MLLLQPIDRAKNIYGINMYVNKKMESLIIESVGKGFDVSDLNCGESAGQSVMHIHMHLIPRYKGDVDDPCGGVRGVIPNKKNY